MLKDMILNRTMAEVEQNKGSQNSHTSTTEPIQSASWFILHHEQCHTATYSYIQYYSSAPCAMHTRTDCPMQHYTEVKVLE